MRESRRTSLQAAPFWPLQHQRSANTRTGHLRPVQLLHRPLELHHAEHRHACSGCGVHCGNVANERTSPTRSPLAPRRTIDGVDRAAPRCATTKIHASSRVDPLWLCPAVSCTVPSPSQLQPGQTDTATPPRQTPPWQTPPRQTLQAMCQCNLTLTSNRHHTRDSGLSWRTRV